MPRSRIWLATICRRAASKSSLPLAVRLPLSLIWMMRPGKRESLNTTPERYTTNGGGCAVVATRLSPATSEIVRDPESGLRYDDSRTLGGQSSRRIHEIIDRNHSYAVFCGRTCVRA